LPIKTNNITHFLFCPVFQYGHHLKTTAVSVHVTWGGDYYYYKSKVKQSCYTPWRCLGGEEV
jgi:hypothetical protein